MNIVEWNSSLSVKVTDFDLAHQKLFRLINELNNAMLMGKGKDVAGNILKALVDYTKTHFADEEKYFVKFAYPETAAHKKQHAEFTAAVSDFESKLAKGEVALSSQIMSFLKDWLTKHIKGTDQKYGDFFNAKGLK